MKVKCQDNTFLLYILYDMHGYCMYSGRKHNSWGFFSTFQRNKWAHTVQLASTWKQSELYRSHSAASYPVMKAFIFLWQHTVPCTVHAVDKPCHCMTPVTAFDLHVLVSTDSGIINMLTCFTVSLVKAKHPDYLLLIQQNKDMFHVSTAHSELRLGNVTMHTWDVRFFSAILCLYETT